MTQRNMRTTRELSDNGFINTHYTHGRRPRGTGGRSPKNLKWGTAHASVPPIFGEVSLSANYELTKQGVMEECFVLNRGFS